MTSRLTPLLLVFSIALAACVSVLGFRRTAPSHPFEHRAHVLKGINCVTCHEGIQSSDSAQSPLHFPTDATCRSCHTKPHDERSCGNCHGEGPVRGGVALVREHLRFNHKKHMAEVDGDCVHCHREVVEEAPDAPPLPKMATCFGCHQHKDQWTLRDCSGCHVDLSTEEPPSSHLVHDGDWIREHGVRAAAERDICSTCHSERSCAACHGVGTVPVLPARLAFDDVRLSGLHRAGFKSRHALEARADPGLCTTCHSESSCNTCHAAAGVGAGSTNKSPHPPNWVGSRMGGGGDHGQQARIDPTSCAGCHGGAGEQLCVGCHRVGGPGGNPHGRGFSSNKQKMHDLPCRLCHGVGP